MNHTGKKISRIRELRNIKQEALANSLGVSQQSISKIEQSEHVDDATLARIAKALGVTTEAIQNFDEEKTVMNIQNNYEGSNQGAEKVQSNDNYHQCTFNPMDKMMEALELNKKLYEDLLKEKDERIRLIQQLVNK